MKQSTLPANHLGYLDGLRALAATFVVVHHAFRLAFFHRAEPSNPVVQSVLAVLSLGRYPVDLFIVLSGFCLMLPIVRGDGSLRGGARHFFKRRAWRILPPYYLGMGLSLLLIALLVHRKTGTAWDGSIPVTAKSVVTHLILMHDAFGDDYNINGAFWSIGVEWRIYFLFPVLVMGWRRIGPLATTALALAASCFLYRWCEAVLGESLTADYIGLFALGMLGATLAFAPESLRCGKYLPLVVLAGMAAIMGTFAYTEIGMSVEPPLYVTDYCVGGCAMFLLVGVATTPGRGLSKILSSRPLVFVGTFAYSIYLIHAPLLQIFWQYVFVPLQNKPLVMLVALASVATPIIVGLSYLFFLGCERPFLNMGKTKKPGAVAVLAAMEPAP